MARKRTSKPQAVLIEGPAKGIVQGVVAADEKDRDRTIRWLHEFVLPNEATRPQRKTPIS